MVGSLEASGRGARATTPLLRAMAEPAPWLTLETIRDPEALDGLEPEWRALTATASPGAGIYQSFDWAAACAARLEPGAQLCVLAARDCGRLVAIAPLMIDRRLGLATLRWLGGSLAIYGDVLAEACVDVPAWLERAFAELRERGEAQSLLLDNVRADARVAPFLASRCREAGRKAAPLIDLATFGTFEAWRARQSRTSRRSRSRRLRQLEAAGKVGFVFEPAGTHVAQRIARLLAMKRDWAASRKIVSRSIFNRDFEAIVRSLASGHSGLDARVSSLTLDGKEIAIELGFVTDGVYTSYLGAYDPAFEAYSPGALQIERTLEACFAEGLRGFDFQPPADAYKQSLASGEVAVTDYALALTLAGLLQTLVAAADPVGRAKRTFDLMPASCRGAVCSVMHFLSWQRSRQLDVDRPTIQPGLRRALMLLGAGGAIAAAIAE